MTNENYLAIIPDHDLTDTKKTVETKRMSKEYKETPLGKEIPLGRQVVIDAIREVDPTVSSDTELKFTQTVIESFGGEVIYAKVQGPDDIQYVYYFQPVLEDNFPYKYKVSGTLAKIIKYKGSLQESILRDEIIKEPNSTLIESIRKEDDYGKLLSRRTPHQHAQELCVGMYDIFPPGADVLVVGDPGVVIGKYDLGSNVTIIDTAFFPEVAPPLVHLIHNENPPSHRLTVSSRVGAWVGRVYDYDMRKLQMEEYFDWDQTDYSYSHRLVRDVWQEIEGLSEKISTTEAGSSEMKSIISDAFNNLQDFRSRYKVGFETGELLYGEDRKRSWKAILEKLGDSLKSFPNNEELSGHIQELLRGRTFSGNLATDYETNVWAFNDSEIDSFTPEIVKNIVEIREFFVELSQKEPLKGSNLLESIIKRIRNIIAIIYKSHIPQEYNPNDSFIANLSFISDVMDLSRVNNPYYGEVVAQDLIDLYERFVVYFQQMYPKLLAERNRMIENTDLPDKVIEYLIGSLEESWWKTQFQVSGAPHAQVIHGYFPDPHIKKDSYDRIVGVYSISTHAWDSIRKEDDFENIIRDSIKYLKPGGEMHVGPLNYRRRRAASREGGVEVSKHSLLGYSGLANVLDKLYDEGLIEFRLIPSLDEDMDEQSSDDMNDLYNDAHFLRDNGWAVSLMIRRIS